VKSPKVLDEAGSLASSGAWEEVISGNHSLRIHASAQRFILRERYLEGVWTMRMSTVIVLLGSYFPRKFSACSVINNENLSYMPKS